MARTTGYRIFRECNVSEFRGAYQTAIKGIPKMHDMINDSDMNISEKRRMKGTIIAIESVLERQLTMKPREESGETICQSCGATLELNDKTDNWQFCPVCGQRFRDTWQDIQPAEELPETGRTEMEKEIRQKLAEQERKKKEQKRAYFEKWREEHPDKMKEYQRRARERQAAEKERE